MNDLIKDTAALIAVYNSSLAAAFIEQPFRRVDMAYAFAAGFNADQGDERDIHPAANAVIQVALLDRKHRANLPETL